MDDVALERAIIKKDGVICVHLIATTVTAT